jgi:hypothetical protein
MTIPGQAYTLLPSSVKIDPNDLDLCQVPSLVEMGGEMGGEGEQTDKRCSNCMISRSISIFFSNKGMERRLRVSGLPLTLFRNVLDNPFNWTSRYRGDSDSRSIE